MQTLSACVLLILKGKGGRVCTKVFRNYLHKLCFYPGRNDIRPAPPHPISGQRAFSGRGGVGVYMLRPHAYGFVILLDESASESHMQNSTRSLGQRTIPFSFFPNVSALIPFQNLSFPGHQKTFRLPVEGFLPSCCGTFVGHVRCRLCFKDHVLMPCQDVARSTIGDKIITYRLFFLCVRGDYFR